MPARQRSLAFSLGLVYFLIFATLTATSQIVECRAASTEHGYKILLDDVSIVTPGPGVQDPSLLLDRLQFKLAANLKQLNVEEGIRVFRCPKRQPRDGSEFDRPLVEQLDMRSVVLEIWGHVGRSQSTGTQYDSAFIWYALIPARLHELTDGSPPGVYASEHQQQLATKKNDLLSFFQQSPDFVSYASIGVGLKALRDGAYDHALEELCRGTILLAQSGAGIPESPRHSLLLYTNLMAAETVKKAQHDRNYKGLLKLLPSQPGGSPCPK